jgi:methionine-rich copper-binding protein CopC
MRRLLGIAWAGLLLATMASAATIGAQAAAAHAARVSADPADNAVITTGPERVSATFNERLQTTFVAMTVVGPDRNLWSAGEPTVEGPVASIGVRPLGPAGTYTVNYRVTSADGHVVSGSWSFRLMVASTGAPGPAAAATTTDNGIPAWPFAVVAVLLIGAGGFWAVRRKP